MFSACVRMCLNRHDANNRDIFKYKNLRFLLSVEKEFVDILWLCQLNGVTWSNHHILIQYRKRFRSVYRFMLWSLFFSSISIAGFKLLLQDLRGRVILLLTSLYSLASLYLLHLRKTANRGKPANRANWGRRANRARWGAVLNGLELPSNLSLTGAT